MTQRAFVNFHLGFKVSLDQEQVKAALLTID
jgi:hypothetical protein